MTFHRLELQLQRITGLCRKVDWATHPIVWRRHFRGCWMIRLTNVCAVATSSFKVID
jgi:hypothetical protein